MSFNIRKKQTVHHQSTTIFVIPSPKIRGQLGNSQLCIPSRALVRFSERQTF